MTEHLRAPQQGEFFYVYIVWEVDAETRRIVEVLTHRVQAESLMRLLKNHDPDAIAGRLAYTMTEHLTVPYDNHC